MDEIFLMTVKEACSFSQAVESESEWPIYTYVVVAKDEKVARNWLDIHVRDTHISDVDYHVEILSCVRRFPSTYTSNVDGNVSVCNLGGKR